MTPLSEHRRKGSQISLRLLTLELTAPDHSQYSSLRIKVYGNRTRKCGCDRWTMFAGHNLIVCALLFIPYACSWLPSRVFRRTQSSESSFLVNPTKQSCSCRRSCHVVLVKNNEYDDSKNSTSEGIDEQPPYKNRSLAWTNRYRKLIPYESARSRAISLGLRSKAEWDEYQKDGECHEHGPYLPSRPDLMYPDDWVGWEEFLGIMRSYDEARDLVRTLGIQNFEEYQDFVNCNTKRAEGLRIPAKPQIVYRDKGWTSFEDFFGTFN